MPKQIYTWSKVRAGDIVSFRYKGKGTVGYLNTVLVLNPRMPYIRKDKTKTFHLIGLKLESRGNIPTIRNKPKLVELLERIGTVQIISEDGIYRVEIPGVGPRGVRKATYNKLKQRIGRYSVYRTYDYKEARKSQVFLEPIVLPKEFKEVLSEDILRNNSM
jgi:hypothetical protein|tara:strand:- start:429 stop:911 length:483 start_codon:yes stop_codon:yes gene_type:complete